MPVKSPPSQFLIRGRLPGGNASSSVEALVSMPGQVIDHESLPVTAGVFEYAYDPVALKSAFPNIDTTLSKPLPGLEGSPVWVDTVTFTFFSGRSWRRLCDTRTNALLRTRFVLEI